MSLNTFRKYPDKKRRSFIRTKIFCRNFGRPIKQGSFVSSLGQAGAGDTAAPAPASLMVGIINGWFTHHKEHSSPATRAAHVNGIKNNVHSYIFRYFYSEKYIFHSFI